MTRLYGWARGFVAAVVLVAFPIVGTADIIVFDLLGDEALYSALRDESSGSITNAGMIATLSASEGVLNRTQSGFGINDPDDDDTDALNLDQYIDIIFDQSVYFRNMNVSSWGSNSAAEVRLGNTVFTNMGSITNTGDTAFDFRVDASRKVRIYATGETSPTNGFSFDGFSVETIPEPATIGFISLAGILMFLIVRFIS